MGAISALFAGMGDFSAAFGLDKLQFGSILGFYGTECGNILGLGGGFYAALTAMGLLAGEEGGHTAEFLLTHPVSRLRIAGEKLAALAVLITGLNLVCFACGAGGILAIGEDASWPDLLRYHGALLLMQLEIGGLCFGLSALLRRGGLGLAMGLAALLYFAGLLINLDQGLDWRPHLRRRAVPRPGAVWLCPWCAGGGLRPVVVPPQGHRVSPTPPGGAPSSSCAGTSQRSAPAAQAPPGTG